MVNSSFDKQNFDWKEQLHTLCTDETPAMLGNMCGSAASVEWEVSHVVVTHRHALATKALPTTQKKV
jgi:hypothetical protein